MHNKTYVTKHLPESIDISTYGIELCADCHSFIHRKLSHLELAQEYNTLDSLKKHQEIKDFVSWVSKQDKKVKRK